MGLFSLNKRVKQRESMVEITNVKIDNKQKAKLGL